MITLVDLLFPKICAGCGGEGAWLCSTCFTQLRQRMLPISASTNPVPKGLDGLLAAFDYDDPVVCEAIGLMKYQGVWDFARPLGILLAEYVSLYLSAADFVCIPVPLHPSRQADRGFNQARLIAQQLSCALLDQVIIRCRSRPPQATLDSAARAANVTGIYEVRYPERLCGKDILIVDDVITTGSTVSEIARIAKTAGARSVWAAAVARG